MHSEPQTRPTVAVINTSQESIDLLYTTLVHAGFTVVTAFATEFKSGARDFKMFVETYQPRAIVYDLAIPYVMNWRFFETSIRSRNILPDHCFVLTTVNKAILEDFVGRTPAIELIGKPADLDAIVQAVRRAVEQSS